MKNETRKEDVTGLLPTREWGEDNSSKVLSQCAIFNLSNLCGGVSITNALYTKEMGLLSSLSDKASLNIERIKVLWVLRARL